jgi:uncharacterized integral membrane protein
MRFFLILALLLAILVTTFAVQNFGTVNVNFLTWKLSGSLALVLLITFSIGILIGILVSAPSTLRKRMEIRGLKKNLLRVDKDLVQAQSMATPAAESAPTQEENAGAGEGPEVN